MFVSTVSWGWQSVLVGKGCSPQDPVGDETAFQAPKRVKPGASPWHQLFVLLRGGSGIPQAEQYPDPLTFTVIWVIISDWPNAFKTCVLWQYWDVTALVSALTVQTANGWVLTGGCDLLLNQIPAALLSPCPSSSSQQLWTLKGHFWPNLMEGCWFQRC